MKVMRIKELREAKGLSQKEFAQRVGVIPSVAANWETETALPRARDIPKVRKVLDCEYNDLFEPDADFDALCEEG